ncbi:MAG: hypothetical protein LBP94_01020 [Zoogloeaceae bacterium]|jgi:hypothetical protein|nr:hypothetical protein [Zoogloeaceae bacterium]
MSALTIAGRCSETPPAADWRERLTKMLGEKPRRIGLWAELGLYGALSCMAAAGESTLPDGALLLAGSRSGTQAATRAVLGQMKTDLPMPLTFLQTQPSQLLTQLAACLNWQGNACFLAGASLAELQEWAVLQMGPAGALIGWLDDAEGGSIEWLRIFPAAQCQRGAIDR